ncbi:MAG: Extradiol ring-cleavage dioxygenase class protein subunit [Thermomicrobiales bacterium]|nr:Extradiol ring-cleavage dioxygenase class protein subunit [Thermomicrobiales bacterium]
MPLVFAAIAPHGFPLIPDLSDDAGGALATRAAMEELDGRAAAAEIETLVIAGPHGVRVEGAISLADTARAVTRACCRSIGASSHRSGFSVTDAICRGMAMCSPNRRRRISDRRSSSSGHHAAFGAQRSSILDGRWRGPRRTIRAVSRSSPPAIGGTRTGQTVRTASIRNQPRSMPKWSPP